jgi:hypothetical protein
MTATLSRPASLEPAAQAILLRLLPPTKSPPSPGVVNTTCNKLFRQPLSKEEWRAVTEKLRQSDLLESKGMRLTPAGRQHALEFLGLTELPPKTTWSTIQAQFLLPYALRAKDLPEKERKRLNTQDRLAALLLSRKLRLPTGADANVKLALESLVCQKLGFHNLCSLEALKEEILNQHLQSPERLTSKQLLKQVPRIELGAKKDGLPPLRDIALAGWAEAVAAQKQPTPMPVELEPQAFASAVVASALASPSGWFGDNKIFISHVWHQLQSKRDFARLDAPAFKKRLVEANTLGLVTLARADLVQVLNPVDVDESATTFQNATFHFLVIDRNKE